MTMHYDRMTVRMVGGAFEAVSDGLDEDGVIVTGKGATFQEAVNDLLRLRGCPVGEFTIKDESTPADEVAGRRVLDLHLTFDPLLHPEFVMEANMQNNVGMAFDQAVEEILDEIDYKPTDGFEPIEPVVDGSIVIHFDVTKNIGMVGCAL